MPFVTPEEGDPARWIPRLARSIGGRGFPRKRTRRAYAEQLAAIPASYRIVRCPEVQQAARALGQRLLAAGEPTVD
jgi:hypothetical protein